MRNGEFPAGPGHSGPLSGASGRSSRSEPLARLGAAARVPACPLRRPLRSRRGLLQLERRPQADVARRGADLDLEPAGLDAPAAAGFVPVGKVAILEGEDDVDALAGARCTAVKPFSSRGGRRTDDSRSAT